MSRWEADTPSCQNHFQVGGNRGPWGQAQRAPEEELEGWARLPPRAQLRGPVLILIRGARWLLCAAAAGLSSPVTHVLAVGA